MSESKTGTRKSLATFATTQRPTAFPKRVKLSTKLGHPIASNALDKLINISDQTP
jgi:hypothetical protein